VIDGGQLEAPPSERRVALVEAAYRRIAADGFEGLRTRDVAADVGINIATLHYYFPTKEALIRGVVGMAMQRLAATLPGDGSPVEQLRRHFAALAKLITEDRQLCAVLGELAVRVPRDAELARMFGQIDMYWHSSLGDLLRRCLAAGALDPGLDAEDATSLTIAAIRGASLASVAGFQSTSPERVFRQLERMLGLRTEGSTR
jgi:AcrR family transcriptional regulator